MLDAPVKARRPEKKIEKAKVLFPWNVAVSERNGTKKPSIL
jgi:hypothetical protein